jgi:glycosyltransferase involved in cell wall biosynthesis
MQICFYFPSLKNDQNNAIFGSMYSSFFKQLEVKGMNVKFTTDLADIEGDILVVSIGSGGEPLAAKAMHKFKGPVILSVYNAYICFYRSFLKRWKSRILFAYNPDFATLNFEKYKSVGIPYYHFPFGSDEQIFKPLIIEKKYDISFLGNANSGFGREKYIEKLIEYAQSKKLNVFLAGSGWAKFGFPYQIVNHGDETNLIYNESRICVNIHNDRQFAGIDKEMDANNRLFDLAMAGCCQISNGEQMVVKYFDKDEVVSVDNPDKWIDSIDYYLNNETERLELGLKARERAFTEHSWEKRATEFNNIINEKYSEYTQRSQKINFLVTLFRFLDQFIVPLYLFKEIRIVRLILTKIGIYTKK